MRAVILGPSGTGKTILLQNMILDIYIEAASNGYIYILSEYWCWFNMAPCQENIEGAMHVKHWKDEPFFITDDSEALNQTITTQQKMVQFMKDQKKLI